nr:hypothetical protein [Bacillus velezensis]
MIQTQLLAHETGMLDMTKSSLAHNEQCAPALGDDKAAKLSDTVQSSRHERFAAIIQTGYPDEQPKAKERTPAKSLFTEL